MNLRVGTFNILNTSCRYDERKEYIRRSIQEMNCDVIGLQEINLIGNSDVLNSIDYDLHFAPLPRPMLNHEPNFRIDGNGVLLRKEIEIVESSSLIYFNNLRNAQFLKLKKENTEFVVVNTHLDHLSDSIRQRQLGEMLNKCKEYENLPIICTGDYNFDPDSNCYKIMSSAFTSTYHYCNKKEPELTFPTGLSGDNADKEPYGCLDYIWCKGNTRPEQAVLFTNCGQKDVWASDHYPLYCDIKIS
jgi:endonuclease/exonuclease/phosphatase family metal-dependent hydrolase